MHNLSLVLFTVLVQAAAGLVILSTGLLFLASEAERPALLKPLRTAISLPLPLVAGGILASFFHLGDPLGGYRALTNLASSWMSREILFVSLFLLSTAACLYAWRFGSNSLPLMKATGLGSSLLGLIVILVTGMVYQLPTRPEWNHWSQLMAGLVTALLLGGLLLTLLLLRIPGAISSMRKLLGWTVISAVLLMVVSLACYAPHLGEVSTATLTRLVTSPWFWGRLIASAGLPLFLGGRLLSGEPPATWVTASVVLAAVAGELTARGLFYSTVLDQLPLF